MQCFDVNIRLNKNKSSTTKFEDLFWISEEIEICKVKGKKVFNQMAAKAKIIELTEASIEAFSGGFRIQTNI